MNDYQKLNPEIYDTEENDNLLLKYIEQRANAEEVIEASIDEIIKAEYREVEVNKIAFIKMKNLYQESIITYSDTEMLIHRPYITLKGTIRIKLKNN